MSPRNPRPVVMMTGGIPWPIALFLAFWRWVFRMLYRHRSALAPAYYTLAVITAGIWVHATWPGVAWVLLLATAALCAVLAALPRLVRLKGRPGVPGWLLRPVERLYMALVTGATGAWLAAAAEWGALAGPMPTVAFMAMALMGVPWWLHRRRRSRVEIDQVIEAWPIIGEAAGLPGSRVLSAVVDRFGFSARILLRRGQTATDASARIGALESGLGARPGGVRIEPDPHRADQVTMRVLDVDPHARPIRFPDPAQLTAGQDPHRPVPPSRALRRAQAGGAAADRERWRTGAEARWSSVPGPEMPATADHVAAQRNPALAGVGEPQLAPNDRIGRNGMWAATITRPFTVGIWEDGKPVSLLLDHRHVLIGGIAGSGKSGVLNVLMAWLTLCADVVIWGIDLKAGMELNPWLPRMARLATRHSETVTLLADAVDYLEDRAGELTRKGKRLWSATPKAPALVIVIDEYADLPPEAKAYADSIARRGRAPSVTLILATQKPSQAAMGNNAVRSQVDVRIGMRVRERRDVDLIMGQGMLTAGWHLHTLDAPGKFLLLSPENNTPTRGRAFMMTDRNVTDCLTEVMLNFPTIPELPPLARHAVFHRPDPLDTQYNENDENDENADGYGDRYADEDGDDPEEEYPPAVRDNDDQGEIYDPRTEPAANDGPPEMEPDYGHEYRAETGPSVPPVPRQRQTPEERPQEAPGDAQGDVHGPDGRQRPDSRARRKEQLGRALLGAGAAGMTVPELMEVSGRAKQWVYNQLNFLESVGLVERFGHGRWRAVGAYSRPQSRGESEGDA